MSIELVEIDSLECTYTIQVACRCLYLLSISLFEPYLRQILGYAMRLCWGKSLNYRGASVMNRDYYNIRGKTVVSGKELGMTMLLPN